MNSRVINLLVPLGLLVAAAASDASTNESKPSLLTELGQRSKNVPFKEVILATTQHRVLDFDTNNPAHRGLLQQVTKAANLAAASARSNGLFSARINEAGNHMEAFVKAALREAGLTAQTPVTEAGRAQATGYPDVEITGAVPCYLELKTYSAETVNTTQRSFYYSPSETPKVSHDALHFLLAYELTKVTRDHRDGFVPVRWKLITLQDLEVDLKFEFNQSNRGLYGKDARASLLSEGPAD